VNTMPEATLEAFESHGEVARTVDEGADGAAEVYERLAELGVDTDDVSRVLEEEGVASFATAFDGLITTLEEKVAARA